MSYFEFNFSGGDMYEVFLFDDWCIIGMFLGFVFYYIVFFYC